jgi:hypothetical protein
VPWAKATEARLSETATASSSTNPSFLDKTFSFTILSLVY